MGRVCEVGGVIALADARGRRVGRAAIEGPAGHQPRLAVGVRGFAGSPAFGCMADEPAMFGQRFAPAFELSRKITDVIGGLFELPGVAPGKQASPRGGTLGVGRIGVRE